MKHIYLLVLSVIGFGITWYIWNKKSHHQKLVCMIGDGGCNKVVTSEYSTLFGIDNTVLGMLFFGSIIAASIVQQFIPTFFAIPLTKWSLLLTTGGSAAFSLYLTYIQFAIIKQKCEYCLASAVVNILIFLVVFFL